MQLVSRAADSFCNGDLVDRTIRNKNSWNLLPTQAMFASVIPGILRKVKMVKGHTEKET